MPFDPQSEIARLKQQYQGDPTQSKFSALVLGESGTGKSHLLGTARMPLHVDSFDPGGTKTFKHLIDKGKAIVDTVYEHEDPSNPSAYKLWKTNFVERLRGGYFKLFATYSLDSSTFWGEAIMNWLLGKDGIAGQAPRFTKDYTPQKIEIRNMMRLILTLPCDVIVTGHLKLTEDKADNSLGYKMRYLTTGQGTIIIPMMFDEIFVTMTKPTARGVEYRLLTKAVDPYLARSRLAQDGKLETYEEPDIKKLLKKAGYPTDDLPML